MKKYFKFIFILPVLIMASCSEEFVTIPVQDASTSGNFFKSEVDVRAATAALYGSPWFQFNDKFNWAAGEELAGNLYHTWDQEGQFFYYSYNAGNAHIRSGWLSLYRVVAIASSIINDMPVFATAIPQDVQDRAIAEAKFARAVAYFILTEFWGEVPIVENVTAKVVNNEVSNPKNTKESIYEFIKRDLEFAASKLPLTDTPGRATQWSAKGYLAKTYLTMAQYYSKKDATKATEFFNKSKTIAADVIDNSGLKLMENYSDLFLMENNNNPESLFAIQFMQGSYSIGNSLQANFARSSLITGNTEAWGGGKCMTYDFLQDVNPNDKRKSAIYMDLGDVYPDINKANGGYKYFIVNRDPSDPNKVLEGASPTLNHLKKYVVGSAQDHPGKVSTGQATAINQYMLRLADVYLVYVEAAIGLGDNTSDGKALGYLNTIRNRAGLPAKTSVTFRELLKERRVEFGMESMYWYDIKRFFYRDQTAAVDMLSNQKREYVFDRDQSSTAADENTKAGYVLRIAGNNGVVPFNPAIINVPIPASEVVLDPMLAPDVPAVDYNF